FAFRDSGLAFRHRILGNPIEKRLHCSDRHTLQSANPDCRNLAPLSGGVRAISGKPEVSLTGLRNTDRQNFVRHRASSIQWNQFWPQRTYIEPDLTRHEPHL